MNAHRRRSDCRLCGSRRLEAVLELPATPIADAYLPKEALGRPEPAYPLGLAFCLDCSHVQLRDVVDPSALFENYAYVSSSSAAFVEHFKRYADAVVDRYRPTAGGLAVDVGSNDGTFLKFLKARGLRVLGVDPAREIARQATAAGVETVPAFFTPDVAKGLRGDKGPAAIVSANNAFAHADDLGAIADGVRELLGPDGVFVFEVSYLLDVLDRMMIDTVYHEHLSYHSLKPLKRFLESHGLELVDIERIPEKGGSLRGTAQRKGGPRKASPAVAELLKLEDERKLDRFETLKAFADRLEAAKKRVAELVDGEKAAGRMVAGYGAAQGATTQLFYFGLGSKLACLFDDNPKRQGLYSPGHHLEVLPSEKLYEKKPSLVVLLAWTYAPQILKRHERFRKEGGKFVIPLPKTELA
jgi:SAM-dependent methyltransferase